MQETRKIYNSSITNYRPCGRGEDLLVISLELLPLWREAHHKNFVLQKSVPANCLIQLKFNINTASISELETLPGIGRTKAQAIVDLRNTHANLATVDDLDNVPGIGPATINLIRPYVKIYNWRWKECIIH